MSLRWAYKMVSVSHPVWALGGRWVRPRPLIPVSVIGPTSSRLKVAHLDTAADDTVFAEVVASQIGLDLTNAPGGMGTVMGGRMIPLRYAQVTLRITDG